MSNLSIEVVDRQSLSVLQNIMNSYIRDAHNTGTITHLLICSDGYTKNTKALKNHSNRRCTFTIIARELVNPLINIAAVILETFVNIVSKHGIHEINDLHFSSCDFDY